MASDHIEWPFILAMLASLGFGPKFIQALEILFIEASSCITMNGLMSLTFGLFCSICQGFPLAPSLYVLFVEGFCYLLSHSTLQGLVQGISLPNSPSQLINGHFANDSFLTLLENEDNIKAALA